ncbi:MAG: hypothetical protein R3F41_02805 [Gammaproteobacteria bacterium]|nr:hypothetical protein [Pseudomonadales bacterium]MCP5345777.1 hypothetical protein [Pseudomonadales bacterium]
MAPEPVTGRVNLVVALGCEARPLIRHFALRQQRVVGGLRVYGNNRGLSLLVSGVGKSAVAAACGYLAGLQQQQSAEQAAWLNVGIAGHGRRAVGDGVCINRVTDFASGRISYPPVLVDPGAPQSQLVTVDDPETVYADDAAYDMEGSVYLSTVTRFVTSELCQLFKVVSDSPDTPSHSVTESVAAGLIESRLEAIDHLVTRLNELAADYNAIYRRPEEVSRLLERFRLTVSQQLQLDSLCRRYRALTGSRLDRQLDLNTIGSGRELIRRIEGMLPLL